MQFQINSPDKYCCILIVLLLAFSACKKGQPVETQRFSKLSIPFLFVSDTPPLDLYLNEKLATTTVGSSLDPVSIPVGVPVHITLKKAKQEEILKDTIITADKAATSLMFAYNESLGFNRFINSNDFVRPAADSAAFMFYNNYQNFGSGSIDIIFYSDKNGNTIAEPEEEIGALRNIPLGKLSEKITFARPANPDEMLNIYTLAVDSKTKRNPDNEEVNVLYGLAANQLNVGFNDIFSPPAFGLPYGKINVGKIVTFPWEMDVDDGSGGTVRKLFHIYEQGFLFKY